MNTSQIVLLLALAINMNASVQGQTDQPESQTGSTITWESHSADQYEIKSPGDSIYVPQKYFMYYKVVVRPVILSESASIYVAPDSTSQIIDTLLFNTPIIPVRNSRITDWAQIMNENDTLYLKSQDVSWYSFPSLNQKPFIYFITETISSTTIHKYHLDEGKIIDVHEIPNFIIDDADYIDASNWKNVDLLISLNYNGDCGGCPEIQRYLIDANGEFSTVFTTSQYMDDGEEDAGSESHVHFPSNPETMDIIYSELDYGYGEENQNMKKSFRWDGYQIVEQVDSLENEKGSAEN